MSFTSLLHYYHLNCLVSDEQLADTALVERLKADGMVVDVKRKVVIRETWQEQSIKSAIREVNLRPQLPVNLGKKIKVSQLLSISSLRYSRFTKHEV